jgi:hypothetical protein
MIIIKATNQYLLSAASTYLLAPQPGPGGFCVGGPLNATVSKTSSCYITPTSANCATLNSNYAGTICLQGVCSSSYTAVSITAASINGTTCSGVLAGMTITYSLTSSGSSYVLSSVNVSPVYKSITIGSTSIVTLIVTVTSPTAYSGNPGYQLGKPVTISPSLSAIANPTTGVCYLSTSTSGSISLLFGQTSTYSCLSSSPCSNSYYIDSLLTSTITIQQYASQSTNTITVSGTGASLKGCSNEAYTL